jgi:hypothetical protein
MATTIRQAPAACGFFMTTEISNRRDDAAIGAVKHTENFNTENFN